MNTLDSNTWLILAAVIAYLIGSFPTAYVVTKGMVGRDIRSEGSHNVGAMNAYSLIRSLRTTRQAAAGLVTIMLADMGKGVLAVYVVRWLGFLGYNPTIALIIASELLAYSPAPNIACALPARQSGSSGLYISARWK